MLQVPQRAALAGPDPRGWLRDIEIRPRTALFILLFVVPVVLVTLYQALFSTDRYQSTATIIVTEEKPSGQSIDLSLLGLPSSGSTKDSLVVREFVLSKDMLQYLEDELALKEHYSSPDIDFLSRLDPDASLEDFHAYYLKYVTVEFDTEAQILHFAVQAFDRGYANRVLQTILERAEVFVDALNDKITRSQMRFFEGELERAEAKLRASKNALVEFQTKHRIISTESEQQTILATIGTLESELAKKQSELKGKLTFLTVNSPQIVALQTEIEALKRQIDSEKTRLAGGQQEALSMLDAVYRGIQLDLEFNTNSYTSTLNALEQSRIEAARQLKFLVVVSQPTLADTSEFPDRIYIIGTTIIVCLILFGIASLIYSIIIEHR